MVKPLVIVAENVAEAAAEAAGIIVRVARESVTRRGRFTMAISGGSTPKRMHRLLLSPPCMDVIPWESTHLFWADERCVPVTQLESNFGEALRDFLLNAPIPERNLHPMVGDMPPDEAVKRCEQEIRGFFQLQAGELPSFDLICLGMGADGHTASLFPGHQALSETSRLVVPVKGGIPDLPRLTMTLPVFNHAGTVLFLVTGLEKAARVKDVLQGGAPHLPAAMVCPKSGDLVWVLDCDAASLIAKGQSPR